MRLSLIILVFVFRQFPVVCGLVTWLAAASPAIAQPVENLNSAIGHLSPQARFTLKKLEDLSVLPEPRWKVHVGPLPHAEKTDLDDSGWPEWTPSTTTPADQPVWYRTWVEVPKSLNGYDLTGTRISFRFRFSNEYAYQAIIYFDGKRVALGEALEPITLFEIARPGQRTQITVKIPPGARSKRFQGSTMRIEAPAERPDPQQSLAEFVTIAALLAGPVPEAKGQIEELERAIATVDLESLQNGDTAAFEASLLKARSRLEIFKPDLEKFTFHVIGNSHIDAAWLWPWSETVEAVRRTYGTATELLREYPEYTFTQSAAQYTEWIKEKYPRMNEKIKELVKEGRWEIVGGMWVEPDLNMPDGESLVRQLLVGNRYFKDQYGVDVKVGWNPDSFGYTWQLPQIYKRSGIDYFVTTKLWTNETHKLPFNLLWWESPDGSRVLTYLPQRYNNTDLSAARISADQVPTRAYTPSLNSIMDLYGVGDHGGGPTRAILDEGLRWSGKGKLVPRFRFGTALDFFRRIEPSIDLSSPRWDYRSIAAGYKPPEAPAEGKVSIPTWKDELYHEWHRGVFTTQANHKRYMRESEEWVIDSEKYASLAWLAGDRYPSRQITEAWKKVLFNQFHDLAAGSGIGVIFSDAEKDYEQVRLATSEVSQRSVRTIASDVDTSAAGPVPVMIFNPLAWERSGIVDVDVRMPSVAAGGVSVLDAGGRVIPSKILSWDKARDAFRLRLHVRDVPSMGYKVLRVVPGAKRFETDLKVSGLTIENRFLRVTVDRKSGNITSLFSKVGNFEALAGGAEGNMLQTFADNPKCCDAWNIDPGTLDRPVNLATAESVEMVDEGPFSATIRVKRRWQKSTFVQDITLFAHSDQVEVANDFDWRERHQLLKVSFPLAASSEKATFEIPYGTIERPTTRNNSWEQTRFEVAALRWADLGDARRGFSLINESKYGYDAVGNTLRLTLLRSPTSPDPEADQGRHRFSYSLYPHAWDWKQATTMRRGYEFNYRMHAAQVQAHRGKLPVEHSFLQVAAETVVLTALKKAEDSDGLILRLFEWAGRAGEVVIKLPPRSTGATVTNLMEKPEGRQLPVRDDTIVVPIRPYEILSVRADYPGRTSGKP